MKTIVISAVNLTKGGTLTILRDCLAYLSQLAGEGQYHIVAIVHDKTLASFPHIQYIELRWPKRNWCNRLWLEYVSLWRVSKQLTPVYLWFSLHDTTPNVQAKRRAVYCHNPFPFYEWNWRECFFMPKIVLLALFSKYVYRKNIKKNDYVVVQQQWIRNSFLRMFHLNQEKVVIALPQKAIVDTTQPRVHDGQNNCFIYAAYYDSHKNFECLLRAAEILYQKGRTDFEVLITIKGTENTYARWLFRKWGYLPVLNFSGFMSRELLFQKYAMSKALVFPSKVETWGLPITEFSAFDKPMLLSDLPYAYESAAGAGKVAFFNPEDPAQLANMMEDIMDEKYDFLKPVTLTEPNMPSVQNWHALFDLLLTDTIDEDTTAW